MVGALVPGMSMLTRLARYYALHWTRGDHLEDRGLDAAACQTLVRRTEVGLARVSIAHDYETPAHGTGTVKTLLREDPAGGLTVPGRSLYSPYSWSSGRSTTA
ncbi:hypothetical protein AB0G02_01555 [Actinosynnema sp. NPDC023658]|uniref:hypothetical protein n=1 Tax=Actinosynnema sp. NPDC023658 TaxID=3155465 RepID=UPI0033C2D684